MILKPAKLDSDEYEQIKRHPAIGAKILEPVDFLRDIAPCVRHHHEWYDGSSRGYLERLVGDQIPLPSRLILVCDTVEAMTSDRPYRQALPFETVFGELTKFSSALDEFVDVELLILSDEVRSLAFQQSEHRCRAVWVELTARELVELSYDDL